MALTKVLTGGIADDAIGNTKLALDADYAFTGTVSGAGKLKNIVYVPINPFTLSGGTAQFPRDNTIPLIAEGARVIQYTYEPTATTSTVFVSVYFSVAEAANHGNAHTGVLFFNDACVNVRAVYAQPSGNGGMANMHLQASFSNSNGNDIDIEVRADNVGNVYTINGQDLNAGGGNYTIGTSAFGGANATSATYITITEF
jgi:hypothetical protein